MLWRPRTHTHTQEEAVLTYSRSQNTLATHNSAGYLNVPEACSRDLGNFFLSNNTTFPPNNVAILTISQIIKDFMSSASEDELDALYIDAREAAYINIILKELGHKQHRTPIQTDRSNQ